MKTYKRDLAEHVWVEILLDFCTILRESSSLLLARTLNPKLPDAVTVLEQRRSLL